MKILGLVNKDSAVAYHRIILPLLTMYDVDCYVTNNITEQTFEQEFDIVFYSRVVNDTALESLNRMRDKYGFKMFIDVDDYWILDKWHPLYDIYANDNFHTNQAKHIRNADGVIVTHERLWREVKDINGNVYVCPNAIPKLEQYATTAKVPDERVRLFWQGSATHEADIDLIKYAIENIGNTHAGKIKMVMAGFHKNDEIWYNMANKFTKNAKLVHHLIQAMHWQNYYNAYAFADVCLVPLVNSRFNSMKSNLKVLEAANMGLPVIAHNVHPYKDLPVTYATGTTEWTKAMKMYIDSEAMRIEKGAELKSFCDTFFNFKSINHGRKEIFDEATKQSNIRYALPHLGAIQKAADNEPFDRLNPE